MDGAYDQAMEGGTQRAGWGFVVVTGGDGRKDTQAKEIARGRGRVILDRADPSFIGATRDTNNTGELSGLVEALLWLINIDTGEEGGPSSSDQTANTR